MIKACFLCPIYDSNSHFDFGYGLIDSLIINHITTELVFVFSNNEQKEKFEKEAFLRFKYQVASIVLPKELEQYKSKVTVKKFYGLKELMNDYDYIACIDCETKFIKNADFG